MQNDEIIQKLEKHNSDLLKELNKKNVQIKEHESLETEKTMKSNK